MLQLIGLSFVYKFEFEWGLCYKLIATATEIVIKKIFDSNSLKSCYFKADFCK